MKYLFEHIFVININQGLLLSFPLYLHKTEWIHKFMPNANMSKHFYTEQFYYFLLSVVHLWWQRKDAITKDATNHQSKTHLHIRIKNSNNSHKKFQFYTFFQVKPIVTRLGYIVERRKLIYKAGTKLFSKCSTFINH